MVHTLAGEFRPLAELIEAAGGEVPDVKPAFPDVKAALDRLAAAGHRLAVLTNSARATGEQHLTTANLRGRLEAVIGADDSRTYKPDRGGPRPATVSPDVIVSSLDDLQLES